MKNLAVASAQFDRDVPLLQWQLHGGSGVFGLSGVHGEDDPFIGADANPADEWTFGFPEDVRWLVRHEFGSGDLGGEVRDAADAAHEDGERVVVLALTLGLGAPEREAARAAEEVRGQAICFLAVDAYGGVLFHERT